MQTGYDWLKNLSIENLKKLLEEIKKELEKRK